MYYMICIICNIYYITIYIKVDIDLRIYNMLEYYDIYYIYF